MYHNYFIGRWTSRLLPRSSYCKECCNEQWDTDAFSVLVSSGYMPRSGIAGSYGGFISIFKGISILSSIVAVSIYIPTNSARAFLFSTASPVFFVCRLFDEGHSDWCEVISHCSFDLHFSNNDQC